MSVPKGAGMFVAIAVAMLLSGCASGGGTKREQNGSGEWTFDQHRAGALPTGWRLAETNPTESLAKWEVKPGDAAPSADKIFALTHSKNYNGTYNLAIAENTSYADLELTVRVRGDAGEEDQGGGPIWRCRDKDNYYICRINPLESNYRVYKVVEGRRRQLDSAAVDLEARRWYTLAVKMAGAHITCTLDGEPMLEAEDESIPNAGQIGLWTKADAVTSFDDLSVRPLEPSE